MSSLIYIAMLKVNGLYIHFPFCQHLCNYCDFYKHKLNSDSQIIEFQEKVLSGIQENEKLLKEHNAVMTELNTIYIGGGTPSLWAEGGASFLQEHLLDKYSLAKECEFTVEVDPDAWSEKSIMAWLDIGVNRFSIGAQSFNPDMLKVMDRQHTVEQVQELLIFFKGLKVNYSVDLMLGLPHSDTNKRDVIKELKDFIECDPAHFSVYILKTRSNYPHKESLPDDGEVQLEYMAVCDYLNQRGYEQYEVSNFAKSKTLRSKHNLKYWKCESVAALGSNATGLLNLGDSALRYQWKSVGQGASCEKLSQEELLLEEVYMGLRSCWGYDFELLRSDKLSEVFKRWQQMNYVKSIKGAHIELNSKGYLMLDSLMGDLFSYSIL